MRLKKTLPATKTESGPPRAYRLIVWLGFAACSLFLIPQCLDRYLAPRFFFLSAALLLCILLLRKDLRANGDWRLNGFDLLLLTWYGFNLASVGWAHSWSEGIFYAQKTSLLFLFYWLLRQALHRDPDGVRQTVGQSVTLLSFAAGGIVVVQIGMALSQFGLDNERLYDYASGVYGNKTLASDFLYFLLVLGLLKQGKRGPQPKEWPLTALALFLLIVLLQTRTVYLALAAAALVYFPGRAALEPGFSRLFRRKILPAGVLALCLLGALAALKGTGTLAERLNPLTYMDSQTANERRFVWYKTDLLNADHFWLGVGNGSWKLWFPSKNIEGSYRLQGQNVVFTRAHNDYLEIRSEMGLVGVTLFCLLFIAAFWAAFRGIAGRETPAADRHDLLVLATGLLGYGVIQFFDFPRERIELQVVLALIFAGIVFYTGPFWRRLPGISVGKGRDVFLLAAAGVLAFNAVAGWQRIRGEIHNVRILDAMTKANYGQVLAETRAAQNAFYEYNDVALPLAWYEGIAHYQLGDAEKAVAAFRQAYRLNPWSFQVINNYASALVKSGRYGESIPLYEKALEINPRFHEAMFNLSFALYHTGDFRKALDWVGRIDTTAGPNDAELKKRVAGFRAVIEKEMK